MERLLRDQKIERAWSIYQKQFTPNRKDFEAFCEACLQEKPAKSLAREPQPLLSKQSVTPAEAPLYVAACYGHQKIAEHLLGSAGAKIDTQQNNASKDTALHIAAEKGHYGIVQLLLHKNADTNLINREEKTALALAEKTERKEIIALFNEVVYTKLAEQLITSRMPPALRNLITWINEKKIPWESFKDNKSLISFLKNNNILPNAKALNSSYKHNESGWLKLVSVLKNVTTARSSGTDNTPGGLTF